MVNRWRPINSTHYAKLYSQYRDHRFCDVNYLSMYIMTSMYRPHPAPVLSAVMWPDKQTNWPLSSDTAHLVPQWAEVAHHLSQLFTLGIVAVTAITQCDTETPQQAVGRLLRWHLTLKPLQTDKQHTNNWTSDTHGLYKDCLSCLKISAEK